jgi:ribosome biogenesis GTPase
VIANKVDLAGTGAARAIGELESIYGPAGYPVLGTSAHSREGIDELSAQLASGVYAFVGESGVGKSSLLMCLDPALELKVNEVGERGGRGRHTTTFSELYPFRGGYLADTPGVQTFGFPGVDPHELPDCFPEIAAHEDCRYQPCTHSHEPQCGVKEAVDAGNIPRSRYTSYLHILAEVEGRLGKRRPR